jgi:hypothetical protein
MISKLLNRKKSYERMMRVDESSGSQSVLQGNIRQGGQIGYQHLEQVPQVNGRSSELNLPSTNRPRLHVIGGSNIKKQPQLLEINGQSSS